MGTMKNCVIKYIAKIMVFACFLVIVLFLFRQESVPIYQARSQETARILAELFVEKGIYVNNEDSLKALLTREYSLSEMGSIFRSSRDVALSLGFVEVFCPIEVLRENEGVLYTVYKIKEGGYWYLFWDIAGDYDVISCEMTSIYPYVASVIYLKECKDARAFNALKIGQSTLKEVLEIDPYLEWDDLGSYATYSYSILNKDMMAVVQYVDGASKKEDNLIELIFFVNRTDWYCYSSGILDCDLPF